MKNPIESLGRAYLAFDQFLVDRANEAVKTWNWTTGRTRADLANLTNLTGFLISYLGSDAPLVLGIPVITGYCRNKSLDEYDSEYECDVLNSEAEKMRKGAARLGPAFVGTGLGAYSVDKSLHRSGLFGIGLVGMGISEYIMRADYQKPSKDCVRRGIEKISKMAKEARTPTPEPAPIRAYSLEK